jgi:hypothetical protein
MNNPVSQDELWAGIDLKLDNASFHFERMSEALQPPKQDAYTITLESSDALVGGNWHRAFYAHLDAFLSMARSVPELIRCCFGMDDSAKKMREWFDTLDHDEQKHRREFGDRFKADYDAFRALPLGTARHISEHRTGFAPVTVTVTGRFGLTYSGNPAKPIPISESREMPPELGWMQKHMPVRPMWTDFKIDGESLFAVCDDYLRRARALVGDARILAEKVHGNRKLTCPPVEM